MPPEIIKSLCFNNAQNSRSPVCSIAAPGIPGSPANVAAVNSFAAWPVPDCQKAWPMSVTGP